MSTNNQVFLHGRIARDPELRQTTSNKAVCRFTVATQETKDISEFHNVSAWDKNAESISKYFHKGDPILLWGRLNTTSYERDGHKVYSTSVIVERWGFPLGKPKEAKPTFVDIDDDDLDGELPY